jgi:CheY-like chemotaxis protein
MNAAATDVLTPSILVLDDERQIHSSLRLRLSDNYRVTCRFDAAEALELIRSQPFDLCITDVHMPNMDGLSFIEAARKLDPALGYVVLSGHDTEQNLRRTIPLQVFEFIPKPLPDRKGFEARLPGWIASTRQRRQELNLATGSQTMVRDLALAMLEKDVESTASESAREALLQTAGKLTTIQALLLNLRHSLASLDRKDPKALPMIRCLQEAQQVAGEAAAISDGYFASAYADRESSAAVLDPCISHAVAIALRRSNAEQNAQTVDFVPLGRELALAGITGIDFLLMFVPALMQAISMSAKGSTILVRSLELSRLDEAIHDSRWREMLWVNRRNANSSCPGVAIAIRSRATPLSEPQASAWFHGKVTESLHISSQGILHGVIKAKGLIGLAIRPEAERHEMVIVLSV